MKCNYFSLFSLLNKRILKKPSFIIILLLIPLISFGMKIVASNESGIVRIALCREGNDSRVNEIVDDLMNRDTVFLYSVYDDVDDAIDDISNNSLDAIWVFSGDYSALISDYTENAVGGNKAFSKPVNIIEKEDTVLLKLARMELFGVLYSDLSYSLYKNYINISYMNNAANEKELAEYYHRDRVKEAILDRRFVEKDEDEEKSYLFTPIRGILILLVLLCGLAAAMYYRDDLDKEIFSWMPVGNTWIFEHVYLAVALIDGAIVVYITMVVLGLVDNPLKELGLIILYIPMCDVFCSIIRKLTFNLKSLATSIPIIMILMIVLCPVFISLNGMRLIQLLLPPFYYLFAKNNGIFALYGALYLAVTIVVDVLMHLGSRCSS